MDVVLLIKKMCGSWWYAGFLIFRKFRYLAVTLSRIFPEKLLRKGTVFRVSVTNPNLWLDLIDYLRYIDCKAIIIQRNDDDHTHLQLLERTMRIFLPILFYYSFRNSLRWRFVQLYYGRIQILETIWTGLDGGGLSE